MRVTIEIVGRRRRRLLRLNLVAVSAAASVGSNFQLNRDSLDSTSNAQTIIQYATQGNDGQFYIPGERRVDGRAGRPEFCFSVFPTELRGGP